MGARLVVFIVFNLVFHRFRVRCCCGYSTFAPLRRMSSEWFSDWFGTEYYKMLYGHRDNSEAMPLVRSILKVTELEAGSGVWDMACGRGRHLHWFAEAGLNTCGSDLSEESILEAAQNVPSAQLRVHDMRLDPPFEPKELVVNLFTSMGYFDTKKDDMRVLSRAFEAVKVGGFFVLDFLNADTVAQNLIPKSETTVNEVLFVSTRSIRDGYIVKDIQVQDAERTLHFQERVCAYGPDDLEKMVVEAGFELEGIFGKDMKEPVQGSDRCVVVALKK